MLRENIVKVVGDVSGFVGQLEKARDEEPHMDDDQKRLLSASIYCEIGKQLDACENLLCRVTQLSHPPPQLKKSSHLHAARLIVKKHSMGLAGLCALRKAEWHIEQAWVLSKDVPCFRDSFISGLAQVMLAQVNWTFGK